MKYLAISILAGCFAFCNDRNNIDNQSSINDGESKLLLVEKFIKLIKVNEEGNHTYEKRLYDKNRNLLYLVEISKGACNVTDSIIFKYNDNNQLRELVEYLPTDSLIGDCATTFKEGCKITFSYDNQSRLIKSDTTNKTSFNYHVTNNNQFKDSLNLLNTELLQIQFIASESSDSSAAKRLENSRVFKKKKYNSNFIPSIFLDYGLPIDAFLDSANIYSEGDLLIKDEYFFKNVKLRRTFSYSNNLIEGIEIIVEENQKQSKYYEGFNYLSLEQLSSPEL